MKIAFDAKRVFNNQTGLGNYSRVLTRQLVKQFPENNYFLYTPKVKIFNEFLSTEPNVKRILPTGIISKTLSSIWRKSLLRKELLKKEIKIYHGLSNELPVGIEKTTIKSIVTIHDLIFLKYKKNYPWIDKQIYTQKFRSAVNRADKVIATSIQTKRDIMSNYGTEPSKIVVIYQDCDDGFKKVFTERQKYAVAKKYNLPGSYILSVGTFERRKNHLSLLKAFHALNNDHFQLVLVGKRGDAYPEIIDFIKKNKLKDKVIIRQNIDFIDLPVIYQSAHLFVYPSFYEGFGIPILEALHSRIPVITSNISSMPEVAGNAAILVDPTDLKQLTKALKMGISDYDLRTQLLENALGQLKQFDSSLLAEKLMDVYQSLLKPEY